MNNCVQPYKPNHIKITEKILNRIPVKYLEGLEEIRFWDDSKDSIAKQVSNGNQTKSTFNIYMGGFSKNSSFSITHFNIVFINLVADHVVKILQPNSNDKDILAIRQHRINSFGWMWLGYRQPMVYLFMAGNYLYSKVTFIRKLIDHRTRNLLRDSLNKR